MVRLGTILVAIGDGLVIPKMKEFGFLFKGRPGCNALQWGKLCVFAGSFIIQTDRHPLPRLMFTWAPLEASFALCLFGVLSGGGLTVLDLA